MGRRDGGLHGKSEKEGGEEKSRKKETSTEEKSAEEEGRSQGCGEKGRQPESGQKKAGPKAGEEKSSQEKACRQKADSCQEIRIPDNAGTGSGSAPSDCNPRRMAVSDGKQALILVPCGGIGLGSSPMPVAEGSWQPQTAGG